jgi:phosphoglycolate phosphatase-like HAD superfamily hydrolase
MRPGRSPDAPSDAPEGAEDTGEPIAPVALPMAQPLSAGAGNEPVIAREEPEIAPRAVPRGVVVFDLDGTILDDIKLIAHVAADVLHGAFGTPPEEARRHYLATTGMPFEAQLAQLYPDAPLPLRLRAAATFHERKVREAYTYAHPFPEVPKLLKRLETERWTLVISTGAEREMAELILEREGLRIWFEAVLGSGQGTKREHLAEYRRRYPGVPVVLIGDSRFDLEAARDANAPMLARAAVYPDWTLTPEDFARWGALWADYSLASLPEALGKLEPRLRRPIRARAPRRSAEPRRVVGPGSRAKRRRPRRTG